jgi:CRP-like cAMP-binding protein
MKPDAEMLRSIPLLAACTSGVLARLGDIADLARLGPDEPLFREGDPLEELNILMSGCAITTCSQPDGDDAAADLVEPIRPIALPAALRGDPAPFGARTVTSARVIVIAAAELRTMIQRVPALRAALLNHAFDDLQELTLENYRLKLRTSTQRLADYLLSLVKEPDVSPARFVLPYEKRLVAAKLGCTPENLSRIFVTLRSVGVTTRERSVVVRSIAALREFAGERAQRRRLRPYK